jgi:hypothetical protein
MEVKSHWISIINFSTLYFLKQLSMILFTATTVDVFPSKPESSKTLLRDVHGRHLMDEVTLQN